MGDLQDNDGLPVLVDLVDDAVPPSPGTPPAGERSAQWLADSMRIVEQRAGEEVGDGYGDCFRQLVGEGARSGSGDHSREP